MAAPLGSVTTFNQLSPHLDVIAEDLRTVALYKNQGSVEDIRDELYWPNAIQAMPTWGATEITAGAAGQLSVGISEHAIAMQTVQGALRDPKPLHERTTWSVRLPLGADPQAAWPEVRRYNALVAGQELVYAPHAHTEESEELTVRCFIQGIKVVTSAVMKHQVQLGGKE